jgi:hypothetical protein
MLTGYLSLGVQKDNDVDSVGIDPESVIDPHIGLIAAMGTRGRAFGLLFLLGLRGRFGSWGCGLRIRIRIRIRQSAGEYHFSFVAAILALANLFLF